jgi:hypothetical protein
MIFDHLTAELRGKRSPPIKTQNIIFVRSNDLLYIDRLIIIYCYRSGEAVPSPLDF